MKILKSIVAFVASLRGRTIQMANSLDHKAMLYKLLGCEDTADETMINSRYADAMKAPADDDAQKAANELKAANEAKVAAETLFANEKTAAATEKARADKAATELTAANAALSALTEKSATLFANERKERVKLILDSAVTGGKITGAQRTTYDTEFANIATFDATFAKLTAEKGTNLPGSRQAGMANIGSRRPGMTPEDSKRQETIGMFANEIGKRPIYEGLTPAVKYQRVMVVLQQEHPELYPAAE